MDLAGLDFCALRFGSALVSLLRHLSNKAQVMPNDKLWTGDLFVYLAKSRVAELVRNAF